MEPVSPQDATLWCATTPQIQLQIGALCRLEGDPLRDGEGRLRLEDLRDHVESRLHLAPRFRQRVRGVPLDLARPVWADDEDFDIARHVRTVTLDRPGSDLELRGVVAEALGQPLDSAHPLWDLLLVDGLDDGDVALLLRVHHVLADGLSLLRVAAALLDFEPDGPPGSPPTPWRPAAAVGPAGLVAAGLVARHRSQLGLLVGATRQLLDPRHVVSRAASVLRSLTSSPEPAPPAPLTGRVGTRRDFVWASVPFTPLQQFARTHGVTLNDVILTAVAMSLRQVLGPQRVDAMSGRVPKVLVPVGDATGADPGNSFSFLVTGIPVDIDDPLVALRTIHEEMIERKASGQSGRLRPLFSVVDLVPIPLLRRAIPEVLARQPLVNLAVSNLPGSEIPLYLLGARLRELQPIITGVGNIACIIGVLSYCDQLGIGITVDPDVVGDVDGLLEALVETTGSIAALTGG